LVTLDSASATRDFFVRMVAAADAAGDPAQALDLATLGATKFPADDELRVLRAQFLRRAGDLTTALDVVTGVVTRNAKAPNAILLKARIEADLRSDADVVLATLRRALDVGETRAAVSINAVAIGQAAAKDSTTGNKLDPLRVAIRYYKFADSVQASDTTAMFLGSASLVFGQLMANDARTSRQCDQVKEAQAALTDAQIYLPKAGRVYGDQVAKLLPIVATTTTYADQLARTFCR
jgi:hypothetical protein